jgi:hypothetical protein
MARVDEIHGIWTIARCLLLVQAEHEEPELCFTYAQGESSKQDWEQGAPREEGKSYVNMFPQTLVQLIQEALRNPDFDPVKTVLNSIGPTAVAHTSYH